MSIDSTGKYNEELGISRIQKYASIFGLDEVTGLEVVENQPQIADEYPVMAAIGHLQFRGSRANTDKTIFH